MEDLRPSDPATIGPYRLVGRIGSGGMGVVYLAEDDTGTRVAVKLIRDELAQDPSFRARFAREVRAGQRVGGCAPPATSLLTLIPSTPTSSPNTSRAGTSSISYTPMVH